MKTKQTFLFLLAFGVLFASCKKEKPKQENPVKEVATKEKSLKEYMADSWQTTYLKVEMPSYNGTENKSVMKDKFGVKSKRFARSTYNQDGTFNTWFVDNLGNDLGGTTVGNWSVDKDSLHIEYVNNGKDIKVSYFIEMVEEGYKATSKYDWDGDGEFDDTLQMKTKRIQF
jgi:hypothetical protein